MLDVAGLESVAVDTTARAFFRSKRGVKELKKDIAGALKKAKLKLAKIALAKLETPVEVYYIEVKGLG